ncbi:MAG: hypothetical protein O7F12_01640, partial [Nitrospirae bacterium]|nr:hypothetical protein [Nitrospirota bacterium]
FATRFGSDLDGTIEENPRHSTAMVRVFRLRPVQRWPEDWMRDVQVIFSQVLTGELLGLGCFSFPNVNGSEPVGVRTVSGALV